jgi:hypothetical protein
LPEGVSVQDWLVDEFLVLGLVPLQHWMLVAIVITVLSIVVSAWWVKP